MDRRGGLPEIAVARAQYRGRAERREVFEILRSYPSLGHFLAFQFAIDLNYSAMLDFSEMDFVVAGSDAHSGIRKCFTDTSGFDDADVIRARHRNG